MSSIEKMATEAHGWVVRHTSAIHDVLAYQLVRGATYVVASNNSVSHVKDQADYVCDGTADEEEILDAIDAIYAIGASVPSRLVLLGDFELSEALAIPNKIYLHEFDARAASVGLSSSVATGDVITIDSCMDCCFRFGTVGIKSTSYTGTGGIIRLKPTNADCHDSLTNIAECKLDFSSLWCNTASSNASGIIIDPSIGSMYNVYINGRLIGGTTPDGSASLKYGLKFENTGESIDVQFFLTHINAITTHTTAIQVGASGHQNLIKDNHIVAGVSQYGDNTTALDCRGDFNVFNLMVGLGTGGTLVTWEEDAYGNTLYHNGVVGGANYTVTDSSGNATNTYLPT